MPAIEHFEPVTAKGGVDGQTSADFQLVEDNSVRQSQSRDRPHDSPHTYDLDDLKELVAARSLPEEAASKYEQYGPVFGHELVSRGSHKSYAWHQPGCFDTESQAGEFGLSRSCITGGRDVLPVHRRGFSHHSVSRNDGHIPFTPRRDRSLQQRRISADCSTEDRLALDAFDLALLSEPSHRNVPPYSTPNQMTRVSTRCSPYVNARPENVTDFGTDSIHSSEFASLRLLVRRRDPVSAMLAPFSQPNLLV